MAVLLSSCPQSPAAETPPSVQEPVVALAAQDDRSWAVSSSNGQAVLDQAPGGDGGCSLRCAVGAKPVAWSSSACLLHREDLKFVSADCMRALGVVLRPVKTGTWSATVVMVRYENGAAMSVFGGQLPVSSSSLRESGGRFDWLSGVSGALGEAPHYSANGEAVVLTPLKGQALTFNFSAPPPTARVATAAHPDDPTGLFEWETDDGTTEFANGWENVPPRYRKRARPAAGGDVSVVHGDPNVTAAAAALRQRQPTYYPGPSLNRSPPNREKPAGPEHRAQGVRRRDLRPTSGAHPKQRRPHARKSERRKLRS